MKRARTFAVVASLVATAGILPQTPANCPGPKVFESAGQAGAGQVILRWQPEGSSPGTFDAVQGLNDTVVGRFWQPDAPDDHNNFDGNCPAVRPGGAVGSWWQPNMSGNAFGVEGIMTATGCAHNGCPAGQLTLLIEDLGTLDALSGSDGEADAAYFLLLSVDETPPATREFNFARVNGLAGGVDPTHFTKFPSVDVTSANRSGVTVNLTVNLRDVAFNFQGTNNPENTPIPASSSVVSYDLMQAQSMSDPGRDRANWGPVDTLAYEDAAVIGEFEAVLCTDTITDTWLAVGITFVGDVQSTYVGEAVAIECDPNLADPEGRRLIDREAPSDRVKTKPTRSRGSGGR